MVLHGHSPQFYTYVPLNTEAQEIRAITLHPGSFSDEIACDIRQVSLDDDPVYEALSYTWGSLDDMVAIKLNGSTFLITQNFESALRHLRTYSVGAGGKPIWIDAVCINQTDTVERNSQVQIMATIYKKACCVRAWLGEESDDSSLVMNFLSAAERLVSSNGTGKGDALSGRARKWICQALYDPKYDRTVRALRSFSHREYWFRLWICQELAFSSNLTIFHCGKGVITHIALKVFMLAIHDALQNSCRAGRFYEWLLPTIYPWVEAFRRRGKVSSIFDFSPLETIEFHRDLRSTDPRDKIYGLVGLIDTLRESSYKIDYDLSVQEIYRHFFEVIVTEHESLNIICASDIQDPSNQLPSWCPDWSINQSHDVDPRLGLGPSKDIYNASGCCKPKTGFVSCGDDIHLLVAEGWCIDRIQRLSGPFLSCRRPVTFKGSIADWATIFDFLKL